MAGRVLFPESVTFDEGLIRVVFAALTIIVEFVKVSELVVELRFEVELVSVVVFV